MSKFVKRPAPPEGFEVIRPTLDALSDELRDRAAEHYQGNRAGEANWPIIQINWQRTRYVHEMYYKYGRISQAVYEYCCKHKLIDGALSAKWLEQGYEKLCSLRVVDPKSHAFMTTSVCRVPRQSLAEGTVVREPFSGCRGCASGAAGQDNIFGNKYGQSLAAIQIRREEKLAAELEDEARQEADEAERKKAAKKDKKKKKKRDGVWDDDDAAVGGDGEPAPKVAKEGE